MFARAHGPSNPGLVKGVPSGESVHDLIQSIGNEPVLLVLDDLEASYSLQTSLLQTMQACPALAS